MAKYCRPFMSDSGSAHVGAVFGVLGYLAETFTFLYIGQSLFTDDWIRVVPKAWPFLLWSLLALALSRLVSVYPLVALCNWLTPPRGRKIPLAFQNILWFSGLRGAMVRPSLQHTRRAR
jgi:NhaP-type Na+/H+ or K+/H+ antiporter